KHRDGYEREGKGDAEVAQDKSVASGRTMDAIAAGKGRGPRPFMLAGAKVHDPRAVWHSNRKPNGSGPGLARLLQAHAPPRRTISDGNGIPSFISPQLCKTVSHAPSGSDWVHEIKFDGYRMQLRVEGGNASLRTRTGLDWTAKFHATADTASALPDCILDGEVVALNAAGIPSFSALQAALSEGRSQDLAYFAFDLLFAQGEDCRGKSLAERKAGLKVFLDKNLPSDSAIR